MKYSKRRIGPITIEWIKSCCVIDVNGCWIWQRATDGHGYAQAEEKGQLKLISRVVMELIHGPSDQFTLHSCDRPLCCNPDHLSYGTRSRNGREARDRIGIGNQRLTRDQAFKIKYEDFGSFKEIADNYDVTENQIRNIKSGYSWSDI